MNTYPCTPYKSLWIWPQCDPSDETWACEITNRDGETLHETEDVSSKAEAVTQAKRWIDKQAAALTAND